MGYQLVAEALLPQWAVLPERERLVLVIMCRHALDEPRDGNPSRLYFGGHDLLLLALEGQAWPREHPRHRPAMERVRRALRRLEEAGAVRREVTATHGRKARYELLPRQACLPVDGGLLDVDGSMPDGGSSPSVVRGISPSVVRVSRPSVVRVLDPLCGGANRGTT